MKHLFLPAALLLTALTPALAQRPTPGTVYLGGTVNYQAERLQADYSGLTGTTRRRSAVISPAAGYFLTPHLTLGAVVDWQGSSNRYPILTSVPVGGGGTSPVLVELRTTERRLTLGPQLRYYAFVHDKFAFVGQLDGGYLSTRRRQEGNLNNFDSRNSGGYARLSPGVVYFPTPNVGLELQIPGLGYEKLPGNDPAWTAGLGLRDLRLGLSFYLRRGTAAQ